MNKIIIPNTDLKVSRLAMGCAKIEIKRDETKPERMLDAFWDLGGNLYDTARVYGKSEEIIGSWLKNNSKREDIVIVSKGGHPDINENSKLSYGNKIYRGIRRKMGIPILPQVRNTIQEMRVDLEQSLKSLQTDYIDVYLFHRDEPTMPVEILVETMEEFVREGKIRYYGCSNWTTKRIEEADAYCTERGYRGFVINQALYNVGVQGMKKLNDPTMKKMDAQMVQYHKQRQEKLAMAYSSACSGFFHKLDNSKNSNITSSEYYSKFNLQRLENLKVLMQKYEATMTQVELGFLISQEFCCVPVFGPRNIEDLAEAVKAFEISFAANDYQL